MMVAHTPNAVVGLHGCVKDSEQSWAQGIHLIAVSIVIPWEGNVKGGGGVGRQEESVLDSNMGPREGTISSMLRR